MKKLFSKFPKWAKTLAITLLSVAVAGGGIYGVLLLIRGNEAVKVYALEDVGQYSSSGNAQTEGIITTDRVQSVYISNTQEVTKIHVKEGQRVSVGDELLTFDTTLTDLSLERKDIAVRKLELELEKAKQHRHDIECFHLYVPGQEKEPEKPTLEPGNVGQPRKGAGTREDPLVYLWNESCTLSDEFLSHLAQKAREQGSEALYAVFEQRESDSPQGAALEAWEMILRPVEEDRWSFATMIPEYDDTPEPIEGQEEEEQEEEDDGLPSYTWSQITQLRKDADRQIQELELQLAMARVELETVKHELESGTVKSTINGVVKTVRSVDEARAENLPLILVSGGGGYLVTGALSETELSAMHIGDSVSVLSWESYETYEGTIVSISEFPDSSNRYYHYSEGNRNVSLYPFTVSVNEDAVLREGEYVQMTYDPTGEGVSYFLMNPFVRSEDGKNYVWAVGEKGLEKRYVTTGSSLWGSYMQIVDGLEGVSELAFPYGNSLRPGQKTESSSIDSLYGY